MQEEEEIGDIWKGCLSPVNALNTSEKYHCVFALVFPPLWIIRPAVLVWKKSCFHFEFSPSQSTLCYLLCHSLWSYHLMVSSPGHFHLFGPFSHYNLVPWGGWTNVTVNEEVDEAENCSAPDLGINLHSWRQTFSYHDHAECLRGFPSKIILFTQSIPNSLMCIYIQRFCLST